jgi:WD40 repeat protein
MLLAWNLVRIPNAFAAATQDGSVWFGTIESSPTYRKLPGMHGVSRQVSFSEDGKYLVAGSDDRNIRVWNLEQAAADPFVLRGHAGPVSFVKFSPDGQSVLSMSADKTVRLWSRSGPFRPERSLEPLKRSEPSQDFKRFLDQLRGSPSTFYFAGDVHSNGEIVAASSTGLSLFHPKLPSQPIIEWGALLHWKNVWFATNPDRIVATTEEGVTYTYPYFKDLNALLNFVSMHMPFYGSERMKLSDKEICKLRFDIGQTC